MKVSMKKYKWNSKELLLNNSTLSQCQSNKSSCRLKYKQKDHNNHDKSMTAITNLQYSKTIQQYKPNPNNSSVNIKKRLCQIKKPNKLINIIKKSQQISKIQDQIIIQKNNNKQQLMKLIRQLKSIISNVYSIFSQVKFFMNQLQLNFSTEIEKTINYHQQKSKRFNQVNKSESINVAEVSQLSNKIPKLGFKQINLDYIQTDSINEDQIFPIHNSCMNNHMSNTQRNIQEKKNPFSKIALKPMTERYNSILDQNIKDSLIFKDKHEKRQKSISSEIEKLKTALGTMKSVLNAK